MGDRISGLADPLLLHILSFLQTKDAVATSRVSKRWRHLWRSLPKLHFDDRSFPSVEFFVQFVDAALHLVRLDSVQIFVLKCKRSSVPEVKVNVWVNALANYKLTYLELHCRSRRQRIWLPSSLFICNTVSVLKLTGFGVLNLSTVDLPSLEVLHLKDVEFSNSECMPRLLSCCLHLEELVLKGLKLPGFEHWKNEYARFEHLLFADVPESVFPMEVFSNVQFLNLRESNIRHTGDDIPTFHNLIHLQIDEFSCIDWSIVRLLQGFPKLQSLIICKIWGKMYGDDDSDDDDSGDECWMKFSTPDVPPCVSSHLKELAYFGFEGRKLELDILEYIMKNATVLRTVIVGRADTCERNDFEMLKQLSSYPRCSPNCRLFYDILKKSIEEAKRNFVTVRINDLPDSLLLHILSFLPAKEAVGTCLLSKRWRPLWPSLPTLELKREDFQRLQFFQQFVDKMLKFVDLKSVKKCVLCLSYYKTREYFRPQKISRWINAMMSTQVEHLELHLMPRMGDYELPSSVFTANNIKVLKLSGTRISTVTVGTLSHVNLPLLEVLHLKCFEFTDVRSLGMLLSACALLKHLVLRHLYGTFNCPLDIGGLNDLVTADVPQFLLPWKVFSNARFLHFHWYLLSHVKFTPDIPTFYNLTYLEFESYHHDWKTTLRLLQSCPKLEILVIGAFVCSEMPESTIIDVPQCVLSCLKEFHLDGYQGKNEEEIDGEISGGDISNGYRFVNKERMQRQGEKTVTLSKAVDANLGIRPRLLALRGCSLASIEGVSNPRALPNLKVWDTGDIPSCSSLDDKVDSDSELDMSCKTNIKSVDIPVSFTSGNISFHDQSHPGYMQPTFFPDHVSTGFIYLSMSSSVITVPTGCSTSSEYQHWNVMEAEYFVKELQIGLKTTLLYPSIIIGSLRFFFFKRQENLGILASYNLNLLRLVEKSSNSIGQDLNSKSVMLT
ncbi:hypothetical protein K1719_020998 [Acacia pycnantha]|nr:hypothetical protein K1719_020998 [Acacia pycnantha]